MGAGLRGKHALNGYPHLGSRVLRVDLAEDLLPQAGQQVVEYLTILGHPRLVVRVDNRWLLVVAVALRWHRLRRWARGGRNEANESCAF